MPVRTPSQRRQPSIRDLMKDELNRREKSSYGCRYLENCDDNIFSTPTGRATPKRSSSASSRKPSRRNISSSARQIDFVGLDQPQVFCSIPRLVEAASIRDLIKDELDRRENSSYRFNYVGDNITSTPARRAAPKKSNSSSSCLTASRGILSSSLKHVDFDGLDQPPVHPKTSFHLCPRSVTPGARAVESTKSPPLKSPLRRKASRRDPGVPERGSLRRSRSDNVTAKSLVRRILQK